MKYSFTFDNIDKYKAAKNSSTAAADGGHPIYDALVTNAAGSVSRTCISTIKNTGQTLVDAMNLIVPRKQGGEVGDTLLYNSTDQQYYWLKGRNAYSSTSLGGVYATQSSGTPSIAGYVNIGFVGHREGNRCLIFYVHPDGLGSSTWGVSGTTLLTSRTLELGNGSTSHPMSVGLETVEGYYGYSISYSVATYIYPVSRIAWNKMLAKIYANESSAWDTSGIAIKSSSSAQGWKVDASTDGSNLGNGTISVSMRDSNTTTVYDPADYDYDYEKWYHNNVCVRFPSARTNSVMHEYSGQNSTAILNNASPTDYPIAAACLGYKVTGVSDFGEGKWWWPCMRELWLMQRNTHLLKAKGIDANINYWSCTPFDSTQAWSARSYLAATAITKTGGPSSTMRYLPVTEFYV